MRKRARTRCLTTERLQSLLIYDPETGVFRRREGAYSAYISAKPVGNRRPDGYLQINLDGSVYLAHVLAWFYAHGMWPVGVLDHINRDRTDDRIANLREATRLQNNANSRKKIRGPGRLKGAYPTKHGTWYSQIMVNRVSRYLGCFATAEEAHQAYAKAARELFGEFACDDSNPTEAVFALPADASTALAELTPTLRSA